MSPCGLWQETVSSLKLVIQGERQTSKQMTTARGAQGTGRRFSGGGSREGVGPSAGRGGAAKAGQRTGCVSWAWEMSKCLSEADGIPGQGSSMSWSGKLEESRVHRARPGITQVPRHLSPGLPSLLSR